MQNIALHWHNLHLAEQTIYYTTMLAIKMDGVCYNKYLQLSMQWTFPWQINVKCTTVRLGENIRYCKLFSQCIATQCSIQVCNFRIEIYLLVLIQKENDNKRWFSFSVRSLRICNKNYITYCLFATVTINIWYVNELTLEWRVKATLTYMYMHAPYFLQHFKICIIIGFT